MMQRGVAQKDLQFSDAELVSDKLNSQKMKQKTYS